ncbi:MAG: DUF4435 domain-containing protein [Chloroflexota bacterium]
MAATLDCVELRNRTGRGVAILVEGAERGDASLYTHWFSDRPVAFFAQGSWGQVIQAVGDLRQLCPDVPIFGIIDRDFADQQALDADFAVKGILRTARYTLENYLLAPECWKNVFSLIFLRDAQVPDNWDDPTQIQTYILQAFQACLPLAAYNWVIQSCREEYPAEYDQWPIEYAKHPAELERQDSAVKLHNWGQQCGISEDLGQLYELRLAELQQGDLATWQQLVSGKCVLSELQKRFPRRMGRGQFDLDHYLTLYLDKCPEPQADLTALIQRILAHVGEFTSQPTSDASNPVN